MSESHRTRVVVADDHRIVAEGVRGLLQDAGFEVAAVVQDGRCAVARGRGAQARHRRRRL
jgi:DNA-binding NarL/FixJ family response regulator